MSSFTAVSLSFCAAHAVFLGAIILLLDPSTVSIISPKSIGAVRGFGCISVLAFLTLSFVVDLFSLRRWTFRRPEQTASQVLSRVMVVHLTLSHRVCRDRHHRRTGYIFGVFVVLKTHGAR